MAVGSVDRLAMVAGDLAELAAVEGRRVIAEGAREVLRQLAEEQVRVVVVGQFKRGKSTLINALLGEALLPSGVTPVTSTVTVLEYGPQLAATCRFRDGRRQPVPLTDLPSYLAEEFNPGNRLGVAEVHIRHPGLRLGSGVHLIDTPGTGSTNAQNTEVTKSFLPQCDAVLFVLSADPPITADEAQLLAEVRHYAVRLFFLLNKADYLSPEEVGRVADFCRQAIQSVTGQDEVRLWPVSARQALQARESGDAAAYAASGLADFESELRRFLQAEKQQVLHEATAGRLRRLAAELRLALAAEAAALAAEAEQWEEARQGIQAELAEAEFFRRDLAAAQQQELHALMADVDEALTRLQVTAAPELLSKARERMRTLPRPEWLHRAQGLLDEQIPLLYARWWEQEKARILARLTAVGDRWRQRVGQQAQTLAGRAAQLLGMAPETLPDIPLALPTPRLRFQTHNPEPLGIPDTSRLLGLLPEAIAMGLALRWTRQRVRDELDRNAGRVRHSLLQELESSLAGLQKACSERLQSTAAGLQWITAIETALSRDGAV